MTITRASNATNVRELYLIRVISESTKTFTRECTNFLQENIKD